MYEAYPPHLAKQGWGNNISIYKCAIQFFFVRPTLRILSAALSPSSSLPLFISMPFVDRTTGGERERSHQWGWGVALEKFVINEDMNYV